MWKKNQCLILLLRKKSNRIRCLPGQFQRTKKRKKKKKKKNRERRKDWGKKEDNMKYMGVYKPYFFVVDGKRRVP